MIVSTNAKVPTDDSLIGGSVLVCLGNKSKDSIK